ncbi:MAG: hypothetical protein AAF329_07080 [Cyanobacteria bacterium P01_A01_bin.17]
MGEVQSPERARPLAIHPLRVLHLIVPIMTREPIIDWGRNVASSVFPRENAIEGTAAVSGGLPKVL